MSAIITALDNHTKKRLGENAHIEHGWSHQLSEMIVQFFFQLVRSEEQSDLERQLNIILERLQGHETSEEFSIMYRLIGQTRDLVSGKGERDLTYMQIYVWYCHGYTDLAQFALKRCVDCNNEHPYGSWADIKYFSNYICKRETHNHELIDYACSLMVGQLVKDWDNYKGETYKGETYQNLSLAARWAPREKSKFAWLFKKMAIIWSTSKDSFQYITYQNTQPWKWLETAKTMDQKKKVNLKIKIHWKKIFTTLNKELKTPQINFCENKWRELDFNNVTSQTLRKNKLSIRNQIKIGKEIVERDHVTEERKADRIACSVNYQAHIDANKGGDLTKKIHGKRCAPYELVSAALKRTDDETTNQQWLSNSTNNGALGDMLAMVDTSGSMECDNSIPLHNAIGLGIRIAEKCNSAFSNRIMTFDANPQWVQLNETSTFCEKARKVEESSWGMNTNFYKALDMILQVCVENKLQPHEVNKMVLVVLSDMQIDPRWAGNDHTTMDTMYEQIEKMYNMAGLIAVGQPYTPPHIVFFNLRKTQGFPVLSSQKNVTMLSGYSPALLNIFSVKGLAGLKEFTPLTMLKDIVSNDRYQPMAQRLIDNYCV
jgi:Mg-chelatase subunit ChlD